MRPLERLRVFLRQVSKPAALALLASLAACASAPPDPNADKIARLQNIVVIYAENHSFDNLYGLFPGANGVMRATPEQVTQLDHDGTPLKELITFTRGVPDPAYPRMPNGPVEGPFRIDAAPVNRTTSQIVPSPIHDFFYHQEQINGGKNNMRFGLEPLAGVRANVGNLGSALK